MAVARAVLMEGGGHVSVQEDSGEGATAGAGGLVELGGVRVALVQLKGMVALVELWGVQVALVGLEGVQVALVDLEGVQVALIELKGYPSQGGLSRGARAARVVDQKWGRSSGGSRLQLKQAWAEAEQGR